MGAASAVIRDPGELTPERVTGLLLACGALSRGSVVDVAVTRGDAFNSRVHHCMLRYSPDATGDLPAGLLLKLMDQGWGEREVAFYRDVARPAHPVPRCFDVAFDAGSGASHVILEDLGATHRPVLTREDLMRGDGVPARADLEAILHALAAFHAAGWGDGRIAREEPFAVRPWFADDVSFAAHLARRERELALLEHEAVPIYRQALDRLPEHWERLRSRIAEREALTLSHGDCYLTQFLVPERGSAVIVDLDSVAGAPAAFDLVFLMATFWTPAQRAGHERPSLRTYHDALTAAGVEGFGFDDLLEDYRCMLAFVVFDPVFDHASGAPSAYWRPKMERLLHAFEEWCR